MIALLFFLVLVVSDCQNTFCFISDPIEFIEETAPSGVYQLKPDARPDLSKFKKAKVEHMNMIPAGSRESAHIGDRAFWVSPDNPTEADINTFSFRGEQKPALFQWYTADGKLHAAFADGEIFSEPEINVSFFVRITDQHTIIVEIKVFDSDERVLDRREFVLGGVSL